MDGFVNTQSPFYSLNKDATETEANIRPGPQSLAVEVDVKDVETCWNGITLFFRNGSKLRLLEKVKEKTLLCIAI